MSIVRSRVFGLFVMFIAAGVALSGCAKSSAGPSADSPTNMPTSASYWKAKLLAFERLTGPSPAPARPYSESQAHLLAASIADQKWAEVVSKYPSVTRPTDLFQHWGNGLGDPDVQACYLAAGATPDDGTDIDGTVYPGFTGPNTADYAVAVFGCDYAKYPARPSPPSTDAQLSYYYDYLTRFVVPCYEAHGTEVKSPPSRAEFIEQYQPAYAGARWIPESPTLLGTPNPIYDGKNATCPLEPPKP